MIEHNGLPPTEDPSGRYSYEEYTLCDGIVAMITDQYNEHAWIQSTNTVTIQP